MFIIGVLSFTVIHISTFSGSEIEYFLPEAICCYVHIHCLQIFYHNVDHWGIKLYHHTNFHI